MLCCRIKWELNPAVASEEVVDSDNDDDAYRSNQGDDNAHIEEDTSAFPNHCRLIWEGLMPKRVFTGFRFQVCRNRASARKLLEQRGLANFWDMAIANV